jgi:uncharacterized hydrophobic protein (TIGR00271 family)
MKDRVITALKTFFRERFILRDELANAPGIIENIKSGMEFKGARLWSLIFATWLACTGLTLDNIMLVAGAMIIAPLTAPLAAVAGGMAIYDWPMAKRGALNLLLAMAIVILSAVFYFLIFSASHTSHSALLRTEPTLWDVVICVAGGFAVIISGHGRRNGFVIAGVAIVTGLLPILCAVAFYITSGDKVAFNALYLFITDLFFIGAACFLHFKILRYRPHILPSQMERRWLGALGTVAVLFSCYIIYVLLSREIFKNGVQRFVAGEIEARDLLVVGRKVDASAAKVVLLVHGASVHDSTIARINTSKRFYGLHKADVVLRYTSYLMPPPDSLTAMLGEGREYNDGEVVLNAHQLLTRQFRTQMEKFDFERIGPPVYREFAALFGDTRELSITMAYLYNEQFQKDTALLLYYRQAPSAAKINHKQVEKWLRARLNLPRARVIIR